MLTFYAMEKIAEQRRQQAEQAAAAHRLALLATRTAQAGGSGTPFHIRAARLLRRIVRLGHRPAREYQVAQGTTSLVHGSDVIGQRE